jgi:hypothetical protein
MFCAAEAFQARMELVARFGASWIGLTAASVDTLQDLLPELSSVTVIPHGYVVSPDELTGKTATAAFPRHRSTCCTGRCGPTGTTCPPSPTGA